MNPNNSKLSEVPFVSSLELVGRDAELDHLGSLLKEVLSSRSGRFVFLVGEAGVGKSSLLRRFALNTEKGGEATLLECECEQTQQNPFFPLVKAVAHYMNTSNSNGARTRFQTVLSETFGEVVSAVPGLGNAGGLVTKASTIRAEGYLPRFVNYESRTTIAFARFLLRLAEKQVLVIVIDDLQWADQETIGLLHYLTELISTQPVLTVCSIRAETLAEMEPDAPVRSLTSDLVRNRRGTRVDLLRLPRASVDRIVKRFLGTHTLSRAELDLLYDETEGNPFFLRELLYLLLDRGDLHREGEKVVSTSNLSLAVVPETVREAIRERVQKLPPEFRRTLDVASVVGAVFDSATVTKVVEGKQFEVLERLRDLERIHSLVERLNGNHRFYHVKIQETIYDELPLDLRRIYHRAVADALSQKQGYEFQELAADHYRDAGDETASRVHYEQALKTFRTTENWRSIERVASKLLITSASSFATSDSSHMARLRLVKANALYHLGRYLEAKQDAGNAVGLAEGSWELKTEAFHLMGRASYFLGLRDECLDSYRNSLEQARVGGDWQMEFRNHLSLAASCDLFGDYRRMEEHYRTADAMATEREDPKSRAEVLMKYGMIIMDEPPKVVPRIEEALRLYTEAGDSRGIAAAHMNLGNEYFYLRDLDKAEEHYRRSFAIIREYGGAEQCYPLNNLGMVHQVRGEYEEARKVLLDALAWHLTEYHRIFILNNLANTIRLLGSPGEAATMLKELLDAVAKDRDPVTPETTYYNLGMAYLYSGNYGEAAEWIEKSFSQRTKSNADLNRGKRWKALARAYAGLGDSVKEEHCKRKAEELLSSDVPDLWYYRDIDWEVADLAFYE